MGGAKGEYNENQLRVNTRKHAAHSGAVLYEKIYSFEDLEATHIAHMKSKIRPLIDAINAVFGDHQAKSSLLEAISGVPFPRGVGLITRCATELRMRFGDVWTATAHTTLSGADTAQALDSPTDVAACIEQLTQELCGSKTFSSERIIIELQSPDAPDLTLIDLPGIARTITEGQSADVIQQVDDLLEFYMKQQRTILLAVVPLTQDIATVEVLERCSKHDPEGTRTIGVLTKPDLINPGAEQEAVQVLLNKIKPLKLGYIMVKNRSQRDINDGQTIAQAAAAEAHYFSTAEAFCHLDPNLFGSKQLAAVLTTILVSRIKVFLPIMREEINKQLITTHEALAALGQCIADSLPDKLRCMSALTGGFTTAFSDRSRGRVTRCTDYDSDDAAAADSSGTASSDRLFACVHDHFLAFQAAVHATKPSGDEQYVQGIVKGLRRFKSEELPCFLSSQFFKAKTAQIVSSWEAMSLELVRATAQEMGSAGVQLAAQQLQRFPELHSVMVAETDKVRIHCLYFIVTCTISTTAYVYVGRSLHCFSCGCADGSCSVYLLGVYASTPRCQWSYVPQHACALLP
jgi:interferon-induced GTP-binding protein Mx